jgi:hypothetical protein
VSHLWAKYGQSDILNVNVWFFTPTGISLVHLRSPREAGEEEMWGKTGLFPAGTSYPLEVTTRDGETVKISATKMTFVSGVPRLEATSNLTKRPRIFTATDLVRVKDLQTGEQSEEPNVFLQRLASRLSTL